MSEWLSMLEKTRCYAQCVGMVEAQRADSKDKERIHTNNKLEGLAGSPDWLWLLECVYYLPLSSLVVDFLSMRSMNARLYFPD